MSRNYFYMTRLDIRRGRGSSPEYDRYGDTGLGTMTSPYSDQCEVIIHATVSIEQAQFLQDAMREEIELQVNPAQGSKYLPPTNPYNYMPPVYTPPQPSTPITVKVGQVWKSNVLNGEKTIKKLSFDKGEWRALYNECSQGQYISLDNDWLPTTAGWSLIYDIPSES